MIYLKDITANDIKSWLVRNYGKTILSVFDVHLDKSPDRSFLIRTKPNLLNHPIYLWIFPEDNDEAKPDGRVIVRSLENNTFHHVSSRQLLRDKLGEEMNKIILELQQIAERSNAIKKMTFPHLKKLMKKMRFNFHDVVDGKRKSPMYGNFCYLPNGVPNSRYSETNPTIRFNLHKRTTDSYIDGSKKQNKIYNTALDYLNYYCLHVTKKELKRNNYTIINQKTLHQTMDKMINDFEKEAKKKSKKSKRSKK